MHGLGARRRDVFPAGDRARGHVGHGARWHASRGDRARDAEPRHPAGAVAGRSTSRTTCAGARRGDVRRGSVSRLAHGASRSSARSRRAGVVATPKHFVANVGDGGRDSYPIELSERLLEEMFFPPFEAAITQGGARSVMTRLQLRRRTAGDAEPPAAHRQAAARVGLHGIRHLRRRGHRRRDGAAHTEANTADRGEARARGRARRRSSSRRTRSIGRISTRSGAGSIADSVIDSAVARVLRAKFELGLFEHPYVDPDSAAFWNGNADASRARARGGARVDRPAARTSAARCRSRSRSSRSP